MNESGIWTGLLNNKLGTFKFINVNIIENLFRNCIHASTKALNLSLKFEEAGLNNSSNLVEQKKLKLSKSLTLSSLFPSTTSLKSTGFNNRNNNNSYLKNSSSNLLNTTNNNDSNYIKLIESSKITDSSLINEILNRTKLKVKIFIYIYSLSLSFSQFILLYSRFRFN